MLTGDLYRQLPHTGAMCLIERVVSWDEKRICCGTDSHRSSANPLRQNGGVPALCAMEYAAQALALHGILCRPRLTAHEQYSQAYVVSSRRLAFQNGKLSDVMESLTITAELKVSHQASAVYTVSVNAADSCLLQGDLVVMLSWK